MLWFLLACTAASEQGSALEGVRDLTMDFPDPPSPGMQIESPLMTVGPYEEVLYCYYGIYEGEDIGVNYMAPMGVEGFTHHNQLKAVYDETIEPGSTLVCPETKSSMPVYAPLFESVGFDTEGGEAPQMNFEKSVNWINLPEGIAFKLHNGQRWVMDMHYVNTTGDTLLVNAGINLGLVPIDEVTAWAGPIQFDSGDLNILPHQATTVDFTCLFGQDLTILSLAGHMHDHGTSYYMDWVHDGEEERLYEVEGWHSGFREYPRINNWAPGELNVKAEEGLKTTCSWYNDTDEILAFPYEMCTSVGVVYPLEAPYSCFGDRLE